MDVTLTTIGGGSLLTLLPSTVVSSRLLVTHTARVCVEAAKNRPGSAITFTLPSSNHSARALLMAKATLENCPSPPL